MHVIVSYSLVPFFVHFGVYSPLVAHSSLHSIGVSHLVCNKLKRARALGVYVFNLCRNVDTALFDLLSYFNAINEKQ